MENLGLDFLIAGGFLQLEVTLRFGDFDVIEEASGETLLFGDGLFDLRVGPRFSLADASIAFHLGGSSHAQCPQVTLHHQTHTKRQV